MQNQETILPDVLEEARQVSHFHQVIITNNLQVLLG